MAVAAWEILAAIVLAAHLLCVNLSSAGPLLCIWLEWREARGDKLAGSIGRKLALHIVWSLLAGMVLGGVLGVLVWNGAFQSALARLPSKVIGGVGELVFSLVLSVGYAFWWVRSADHPGPWTRGTRCLIALLSSTNLLYHFPVLFVIVSQLVRQDVSPDAGPIRSAEFRQLLINGELIARWCHFLLAALAVSGTWLLAVAWRANQLSTPDRCRVAAWGARLALVCSLLQIPVGIWLLTQLPAGSQQRLSGSDPLTTGLLMLSLVTVLWLLHQLSSVAMGNREASSCRTACIAMLVVVTLMCGMSRRALDPQISPAPSPTPLEVSE